MKKFKFIFCILVVCNQIYSVKSQDTNSLYIPFFHQMVDFNKNNLIDSVVFLERNKKQDGDSILVVFYKRNPNGELEHFKTFGNLYPIYFKSYSIAYELKNNTLKNIFEDYMGLNPDTEIIINEKKITIIKQPNAITYYYEFIFDSKRNNWFLSSRKTSSPNFTSPTERYFFHDSKSIPLDKYHFLLDIKD